MRDINFNKILTLSGLPADLSVAGNYPLLGHQFFECKRPAGVQFLGRNTDFGTKPENTSVGETGGGVGINGGGVYLVQKPVNDGLILRNNGFRVAR